MKESQTAGLAASARREQRMSLLGSIAFLAVLISIVGAAFFGVGYAAQSILPGTTWVDIGLVWVGTGAVLGAFWPLRYFRAMRGQWGGFLPSWAAMSLTGPFAIVLTFPV